MKERGALCSSNTMNKLLKLEFIYVPKHPKILSGYKIFIADE